MGSTFLCKLMGTYTTRYCVNYIDNLIPKTPIQVNVLWTSVNSDIKYTVGEFSSLDLHSISQL